ncbi:A-kinase anchor protein 14 [Amphibalanus amphitrite]|uniref:A-kinase anchor protein 14 n=1 Tax=Amphibalanus amphitrite TaxID=1232801 RepID=A0A6A4VJS3_AMPAM|nr:A-kinase anchor protein 14 [Amphibalanus amphitrite]
MDDSEPPAALTSASEPEGQKASEIPQSEPTNEAAADVPKSEVSGENAASEDKGGEDKSAAEDKSAEDKSTAEDKSAAVEAPTEQTPAEATVTEEADEDKTAAEGSVQDKAPADESMPEPGDEVSAEHPSADDSAHQTAAASEEKSPSEGTANSPAFEAPVELPFADQADTTATSASADQPEPSTGAAEEHPPSDPAAQPPPQEMLSLPSPPSGLSSVSSLSGDSEEEKEEPHTAAPADTAPLSADLADPLVYDASHATVGAVLGHAADLLEAGVLPDVHASPSALATAADLLRRVLVVARHQLETASASVHRLLPLGLRLAENVMTVPQWRAVEGRSQRCASRAIYQALMELQLPPQQREERRLLRALRRRPARLWADVSLGEAAAELAERRHPDRYAGFDPARDAAREAETALLAAYRAAVRARLTEPVPAVPLPSAAGLDGAARLAAVHEVVKSWRYSIRWRYCVDFLRTEEEPLLSRHVYQVRFSVPEHHQPIPRPVAYVFFVLIVSKVKPETEPIQMYYMTETSRLRHVPGKVIFQEKWLIDIINVKLKFWREIKF